MNSLRICGAGDLAACLPVCFAYTVIRNDADIWEKRRIPQTHRRACYQTAPLLLLPFTVGAGVRVH